MDGVDKFHVAGQGVWIWDGALPDPDQEPRDPRRVLKPDRCGRTQPSRQRRSARAGAPDICRPGAYAHRRSEEHTSELQSRQYLVCRLLLEKKKEISRSTSVKLDSYKSP